MNTWARTQPLPVIAVGDYNFDHHVSFGDGGDRDPGFDAMVADAVFIWVRPATLVKTQASDRFSSVLDFVFVANPISGWTGESVVLARDGDAPAPAGDFDDDDRQTDYRPVDATFEMLASVDEDDEEDGDIGREQILQRLDGIEQEIEELRALVRQQ